jgi:hypothetical protein
MDQSLKQELKQWEASFRTDHGRNPTKEDIKAHPAIGSSPSFFPFRRVSPAQLSLCSCQVQVLQQGEGLVCFDEREIVEGEGEGG